MKAIIYERYGSPDVLHVKEVPTPAPKADELLIKVAAATLSPVDCFSRTGKPYVIRLFTGLFKPKQGIPGTDLAGEVVAVGTQVSTFKVGEFVFAATPDMGAHAEYICLSESDAIAAKPENMSLEEAASVPYGALTALPFLRDTGKIQKGQKVLINGASGAVGTFAVQLAKYFDAEVTGVCSGKNLEFVKSLGADRVIDYTQEDFTKLGDTYDIIFDTVGKSSFSVCKPSLKEGGIFLETDISFSIMFQMFWTSIIGKKRAAIAFTGLRKAQNRARDLIFLRQLIEDGQLVSVIDRCYDLEEAAQAHRYVEKGHKKGNVVLLVA